MKLQIHFIEHCHIFSNFTKRILVTLFVGFLLNQCITKNSSVYGDEWALHIEDGEIAANALAERHNLINLGEVLPETNIYHFSLKNEHRRKRAVGHLSDIQKLLEEASETKWVQHQAVLKRSKRIPMVRNKRQTGRNAGGDRRTCFINTIASTEKDSRRCIFPFEYKRKTYVQCTSDFSGNGQEWCATEVKSNGEVVDGQWGDCDKDGLICYTTKVVIEKESVGLTSPTAGRNPTFSNPARTDPTQRIPVNIPGRQNLPPPSQINRQRPRLPPQSARRPVLPPQLDRRPVLPPQSARRPFLPPQSARLPPSISRPDTSPLQRFPGVSAPQGARSQVGPGQLLRGFPQTSPIPQQQNFEPKGVSPLSGPTNSQKLSREQLLALLSNIKLPQKEEEVRVNTPKLEELKTKWNDPYWPQMWFLNRGNDIDGSGLDMNVEEAWNQGVSGKGVVVTILDDGVEWSHPDLEENYDPAASTDLNDRDADPFPRYDIFNSNKHGTRCAGQVSAMANNSNCGVGVAYHSKIGGVRVLDGAIVDALEAAAMSFNRSHIDIYSASWGPDDDGRTVDGPGPLASKALSEGILKGRNGLGSIFVWASGNGGKHFDNCNADGYTTSIYTLSISSTSENGLIPWYSEPCSSSIATTYSSGSTRNKERKVPTTDLRGTCTTQHTGTSASSPMASGIVALGLEANPNMTWRDVQHLVVRTARPRGNLKARDWRVNGVGLHFSHSYGFGLMDAGLLVKMAKTWKPVPQPKACIYREEISDESLDYLILPGREESFSLDVANRSCIKDTQYLEHFHIQVDLSSQGRRGDLSVSVISPMGTKSELMGSRPADNIKTGFSLFRKWPMMSVHFWGENPVGKWTLVIKNQGDKNDRSSGRATLHNWYVIFYGTPTDPQPGRPLKPNYKESTKPVEKSKGIVVRKGGSNKDANVVEFKHVDDAQRLKNLATICPGCFNSNKKLNDGRKTLLEGKMINEKSNVNAPKKSTTNDEKKLILNTRANVTQTSVVIGGKEFLIVQPEKTTIIKENESANPDNKSKDEKDETKVSLKSLLSQGLLTVLDTETNEPERDETKVASNSLLSQGLVIVPDTETSEPRSLDKKNNEGDSGTSVNQKEDNEE